MRPALLNPLFALVTSLGGVGPKAPAREVAFESIEQQDVVAVVVQICDVVSPLSAARQQEIVVGGLPRRLADGNRPTPTKAAAARLHR